MLIEQPLVWNVGSLFVQGHTALLFLYHALYYRAYVHVGRVNSIPSDNELPLRNF
jgi:hypothetical protein